ncbi:MAG: isoprenylcysteine carboxylmethyltransferase family protein [Planctomycetaceae bacterium]|nr:isoprenylcysteine carboxylmethyltransferase family protein [Planctomycetaceae bacterium]
MNILFDTGQVGIDAASSAVGQVCNLSGQDAILSYGLTFTQLATQWEYAVLYLAATAVLATVAVRLLDKRDSVETPQRRERNLVATLTMTLFFFAVYVLARLNVGRVPLSTAAVTAAKLAGSALLVYSAAVNIAARHVIGRFWSDQIEIQENHQIVRRWPYTWSRHPMYGSLVLFGVGMGLIASNPLVAGLVLAVFWPAMAYRARREEQNLLAACPDDYAAYRQAVPMMMPRLAEPTAKVIRAGLGFMQLWSVLFACLDLFALSGVLTFGLSFLMARPDFRAAYKLKTVIILSFTALAAWNPRFVPLFWLPVFASFMSLSGHCPGTLAIHLLTRNVDAQEPPRDESL